MKNKADFYFDAIKNGVKHWWMLLIVGILTFVIGVALFMFPGASYLAMSLVFGLLILISGIIQLILASSGLGITGRGWLIASGVIEIILGLILTVHPALTAELLPVFLGFWLLFRSFSLIGTASDMSSVAGSGWGWTIFTAILLMICAFAILMQPLLFGAQLVVVWVAISFLIAGISMSAFAFKLKNLK